MPSFVQPKDDRYIEVDGVRKIVKCIPVEEQEMVGGGCFRGLNATSLKELVKATSDPVLKSGLSKELDRRSLANSLFQPVG